MTKKMLENIVGKFLSTKRNFQPESQLEDTWMA